MTIACVWGMFFLPVRGVGPLRWIPNYGLRMTADEQWDSMVRSGAIDPEKVIRLDDEQEV